MCRRCDNVIYNGILLFIKKNEITPFPSNMNGPRDCHSGVKKVKQRKDKYCGRYSFICRNLEKTIQRNLLNKTEIELHICVWLPGKRRGERNWEPGIAIYTSPSDFQLPATLGPISVHIIRSQYQPPAKMCLLPHPSN